MGGHGGDDPRRERQGQGSADDRIRPVRTFCHTGRKKHPSASQSVALARILT
jgi:hypothetical protein